MLEANLVPRVLRLLDQRVIAGRDSIVTARILRLTVISFATVNSQSTANKKLTFSITQESLPATTR